MPDCNGVYTEFEKVLIERNKLIEVLETILETHDLDCDCGDEARNLLKSMVVE